ncbi:hypothetical protein PN36_32020 [Candidatus Thiomargarita nelsonii]|uniref:Uncharacterized protein n=1 Tax=Candidatus Thiomargarita nelsonii TaxID=1003181 RepID=A0A4E0QJP0_9GAMM|nr:hypothetical protein PN36_32020 [Candidatus Thiomargarita nelsonii]
MKLLLFLSSVTLFLTAIILSNFFSGKNCNVWVAFVMGKIIPVLLMGASIGLLMALFIFILFKLGQLG